MPTFLDNLSEIYDNISKSYYSSDRYNVNDENLEIVYNAKVTLKLSPELLLENLKSNKDLKPLLENYNNINDEDRLNNLFQENFNINNNSEIREQILNIINKTTENMIIENISKIQQNDNFKINMTKNNIYKDGVLENFIDKILYELKT